MKKAKMVLSAIAIITVVGGALAFKTNNLIGKKLYFKNPTTGTCIDERTGVVTTSSGGTTADLTTSSGSACVSQQYTTVTN